MQDQQKKNLVLGILAHVDAGKTTLSESMLYASGTIRKFGRVDNGDAFLDTYDLERRRGITIFSKQAILPLGDKIITLLDTPGHVDFSAEMERTLQVLDYAILVVSGSDGVQGHTKTLWKLLRKYQIPVFLFINKMDQPGTDRNAIIKELQMKFSEACVDFTDVTSSSFLESVAMCDEELLEKFLESGEIEKEEINGLIKNRKLFPCFWGSALKSTGIEEFLNGLQKYTDCKNYSKQFSARVYKIARDEQNMRLTFLKVTGGTLPVKTVLGEAGEKVNQIRVYSGEKYETINEATAGMICAVTGLSDTRPGEGLGELKDTVLPVLEPVLTYQVLLPDGIDAAQMLPKLRILEEEEPQLHVEWNEVKKEILVKVMGEVQTEILKSLVNQRFGIDIQFGNGNIVYKETITESVEGVGHFEPLRHYAEVHLLLEPLKAGSGLEFSADCSEDILDKNWQRLVLTHLKEREHLGVLTGSSITDMKITLVAGKAHQKHTEGGDFRQATYRAVRQGLMQAKSVLLEPFYEFRLEIPNETVGHAMLDIDRMHGHVEAPIMEQGMTVLHGSAPVVKMQDYAKEVVAYTKGHGKLFCTLKGYGPCEEAEEVIDSIGYDPDADIANPSSSVFCAHGAGYLVPWQDVKEHMHVESAFCSNQENGLAQDKQPVVHERSVVEDWIPTEEVDAILEKTYHANRKENNAGKKWSRTVKKTAQTSPVIYTASSKVVKKEEYLLVDGYNVIFAWDDLSELAKVNLDGARGKLMDILCNYQGIKGCNLIVVFDAYRVEGHPTEVSKYHNICVVYTKEAETADQYIEKFAHENGRNHNVTVATSDGLEQIIIRGQGCQLISAREFQSEIEASIKNMHEVYELSKQTGNIEKKKTYLLDDVSKEVAHHIRKMKNNEEKKENEI